MTIATTSSLLEQLKLKTAISHQRLEKTVDVLNPALTRAGYGTLLSNFYAFYAPHEQQLFEAGAWAELEFDLEARRKLPLLERDLKALGVALPVWCQPIRLEGFAQLLGGLYVTEGATLGGQVMTRHLKTSLGLTPDSGAAFFASYGERVGSMWLEFKAFLNSQAVDQKTESEIVAGALETFRAFEAWLSFSSGTLSSVTR
jgi:heme oxygenase (biliverdin-IX-beta and delta-forming)